jgi:phosphatidate cytidylyltransferase
MNVKRVLTALIGLPIVVCILAFGNKYLIDVIFAAISIIAMNEYIKCVSQKNVKVISWISYLSVASIALIHVASSSTINLLATIGIPILLLILFSHVIISDMKITFEDITYTLMGILYIFCFSVFLPLTYGIENEISGKVLIWYTMIASWGTDIFAYLIGKRFGKTKFSKVSPNKSVEGCIAGALGAVIISLLYTFGINKFLNLGISYVTIGIISLILSIIGQIGDFSASVIKRYFEVKDFSNLFPGHGGMIDRIDSVIFIAPFAYLLLTMFL